MDNGQLIMDNRIIKLFVSVISITYLLSIINCTDKSKQVTYVDNIAPMIYRHCTTCHRPGSAGSFNLITFEDIKKHLKQIELVTRTHVMPPWPADFNYVHYAGENYLTAEEINEIKIWIDHDAPQG